MISLAIRCQEILPRSRSCPKLVKYNDVCKQFYGDYQRTPAAKSETKQLLSTFEADKNGAQHNREVHEIYETVRSRSQNQIIRKLQHMQDTGQSHLVSDTLLELMTRSIRPYNIFRRPSNVNVHKLYRQRMNYIRKWFDTQRRVPPTPIWFLMLEEARIDKEQHGGSQLANQTWLAMLEAKIEPDVHCYNSYIAATCVQPATYDHARLRRKGVGPRASKQQQYLRTKAKGTVQNAVKIYRQMLKQGIAPNSMTIELLILSLGWEANLDALKSLILQTWNIAVPAPTFNALQDQGVVDEYEEEGVELEDEHDHSTNIAKLVRGDALYPSQETLLAMAMAYGANSQCQLGTKVVLSFAQVYDLTISTRIWAELMKWASIDSEHVKGFTPRTYVEELMCLADAAYGTRSSIAMYAIAASHVSSGDRNPSLAFRYVDKMLASVEGEVDLGRPKFKASKNYRHARQVFTNIYQKISKRLGSSIKQLQNKRARASAGVDERRLLDEDIQRRKEHLIAMSAEWQTRLRIFDQNLKNLIISQRSKITSQHDNSRDDS